MTRKLFVLGYARHGKDTFAELLREEAPVEIDFVSSSLFVAAAAVFPTLSIRYGYENLDECFEDRMNHRQEWHELISNYNESDPARLARELFKSHDVYVGLRCIVELEHARNLADLVVWVDRSDHLPPEDSSSNTITPNDCDVIIPNNQGLDELRERARRFARVFYS
jgi:hypothetical protein